MLDFKRNSHGFHTVITAPAPLFQKGIRSPLCGTCYLQGQNPKILAGGGKGGKDAIKEQREVSSLHFPIPRKCCGSICLGKKFWDKLRVGSLLQLFTCMR